MGTIVSQFIGGKGLFSRLIELKGSGPFSHVDLVMPDGNLLGARNDRVGGKPSGVQIRPPHYEPYGACARVTIKVTRDQEEKFWRFAMAQVGKPYDHMAILSFALNRDWRESRAWICSELCIAAHNQAGVFRWPMVTPASKIDPCTAFSILSTWGEVQELSANLKLK